MKSLNAKVRMQRWAFSLGGRSPRFSRQVTGRGQSSQGAVQEVPAQSPGGQRVVREPGGAGGFLLEKAGSLHHSPADSSEWVAAPRLSSTPSSGTVPGMRAPLFKCRQAVTKAAPPEGEPCPQVHLPRGLPTASWEEASGSYQAGLGLETESEQACLVIPSVCPSHSVQTVPGQALWGLGHQ